MDRGVPGRRDHQLGQPDESRVPDGGAPAEHHLDGDTVTQTSLIPNTENVEKISSNKDDVDSVESIMKISPGNPFWVHGTIFPGNNETGISEMVIQEAYNLQGNTFWETIETIDINQEDSYVPRTSLTTNTLTFSKDSRADLDNYNEKECDYRIGFKGHDEDNVALDIEFWQGIEVETSADNVSNVTYDASGNTLEIMGQADTSNTSVDTAMLA